MFADNNSKLIHIATGEYPVSLWVMKSRFPNLAFGDNVSYVSLDELGYAVVDPVEQPPGDVVTEGAPVLIEGQWTQTWEVRDYNPDELADLLQNAKSNANWTAQDALNITQDTGVECVFAAGNVKLRLNSGTVAFLDSRPGPLIMGADFAVTSATDPEITTAVDNLRAKRQLMLAAFVAQTQAIASTQHFLSIPTDESIRAAITGSVL